MSQHRVKLTEAQRSALECRSCGGLDVLTALCWHGAELVFTEEVREALSHELTEASNCEDAQAEEMRRKKDGIECARGARGAALALANLSAKVWRVGR